MARKPLSSRTAIFYGWTPTGKRIHLGDEARVWPAQKGYGTHVVDTFCGSIMRAWEDGSMPSAGRVTEFCRNCFRALAWMEFEKALHAVGEKVTA